MVTNDQKIKYLEMFLKTIQEAIQRATHQNSHPKSLDYELEIINSILTDYKNNKLYGDSQ